MTDDLAAVDRALGERVRTLRKGSGWTQAELSERLRERGWDIDPTGVTRLEQGSRVVQVRQLYVLADAFGCNPGELLPEADAAIAALLDSTIQAFVNGREWLLRGLGQLSRLDATLSRPAAAALAGAASIDWDFIVEALDRALALAGPGQLRVWKPDRNEAEQRARLYQSLVDDLTANLAVVEDDDIYISGLDSEESAHGEHPEAP